MSTANGAVERESRGQVSRRRWSAWRSTDAFRRALIEARCSAGLTQAELAARVGTTQSAIARLESGTVTPTVETLCRLADVLGVRFEIAPHGGLAIRQPARSSRAAPRGDVKCIVQMPTTGVIRAPTLDDLRARRDQILRIAATHGAHNVRVFGSVARGEAGPESDVDFLVDLEPERTLFDLSSLILDLEEALGRKVDVVELTEHSPAAERIQREAVPL